MGSAHAGYNFFGKKMRIKSSGVKRRGRVKRQSIAPTRNVNYRQLRNLFQPQLIYSDDEVASLHNTALTVLENLGIRVLLPEARVIYSNGGAKVTDDMVFIDRDLVKEALKKGAQALILVPEINLTPQTFSRFQSQLGLPIATMHSGMSEKERFITRDLAETGHAQVIIGTRSAIFTPTKKLGLIIVDEEHD